MAITSEADGANKRLLKWLEDCQIHLRSGECHLHYQVEEVVASASARSPQGGQVGSVARLYPPYTKPASAGFWIQAGSQGSSVAFHLRYFKHELVDLSLSPKDFTGVLKPGCDKHFRVTLEPGYDPVANQDDGFSVTVFFADADLAQWFVKSTGSRRWWETMPKNEVKVTRVEFVMMGSSDVHSDRLLPHLWRNNNKSIDVVTQARTSVTRSTLSSNSHKSSVTEEAAVNNHPGQFQGREDSSAAGEVAIRRVLSELRNQRESTNRAFRTELERLALARKMWAEHLDNLTTGSPASDRKNDSSRTRLAQLQKTVRESSDLGAVLKSSMDALEAAKRVLLQWS